MPMSSGGHVASSSGCVTRPKAREIGSTGYAVPIQPSSPIGRYVMATAEHREPCDSRGSCTVLGAPGGETPPGDSSFFAIRSHAHIHFTVRIGLKAGIFQSGHHRPVIWPTRLLPGAKLMFSAVWSMMRGKARTAGMGGGFEESATPTGQLVSASPERC